jgi:branched-chain amino acid transport system substrate-binding protein
MYTISKGLWGGVIATTFGELPDSDNPLMMKYKKEAFDKFAAKGERWGVFYTAGITFAEPLIEGIKRCGRDLTRERLVKEMEGIRNFKGIGGRISYAPFDVSKPCESRQGMKEVYLVKCLKGGKYEKLSDWMEIR